MSVEDFPIRKVSLLGCKGYAQCESFEKCPVYQEIERAMKEYKAEEDEFSSKPTHRHEGGLKKSTVFSVKNRIDMTATFAGDKRASPGCAHTFETGSAQCYFTFEVNSEDDYAMVLADYAKSAIMLAAKDQVRS